MKSWFLLDVVIRKSTSIFQLLSSKDQTLLIWGNSFLILNLGLNIFNCIRWFDLKGDCFPGQGFDKDLHSSSETEYEMKSWFFLDVVVRKRTSIFQLLASKDQTLLIWGNSFLILNFGLDIFNGVRWLDLKGDCFTCQGFDENLHSSSETEYEMKCGFLLDVVIRKGASIFQLLASKNQTLLIWGNAFLILNFGLYIFNSIRWFNLKSDSFSC